MSKCLSLFLCSFFCGLLATDATAQTDSLVMYKGFGNTTYEYVIKDSVFTVSAKQVLNIMKNDQMVYLEFRKAKTNSTISAIMGFTGGLLLAIPVGVSIGGGQPEWGFAVAGAGLIIGSIPLNRAFRHHAQHAIDTYNKKHTAFIPRAEYYYSGLGAKVIIKF